MQQRFQNVWKIFAKTLALFAPFLAFSLATPMSVAAAPAQWNADVLNFSDLDGWSADAQADALIAFRRSCTRILKLSPTAPLDLKNDYATFYGVARDWQPACEVAASLPAYDTQAARGFFEQWFLPVKLPKEDGVKSLFTGYYEPVIKGSLTQGGIYQTPVLAAPPGYLAARARGETGPSRAAIDAGALDVHALAVVWLADPIDAFFLHVQGSGRVYLPDGKVTRLSFVAKNGLPYTSIGKVLIERGAISRENVSMQTIRDWLTAHPDQMQSVLQMNESYIFFKRVDDMSADLGPLGAEGTHLVGGRSLAVDRDYHPTGTLLWLDSHFPAAGGAGPLRRLMVAQDTGTAIKGIQRGDVFWGSGDAAAKLAGHMNEHGRLTALLPRSLVEARMTQAGQ